MADRSDYLILGFMERHPLATTAEILAAGVTRRALARALGREDVIRLGHGILCSRKAQEHGLVDYAAACLATGGVICAGTAGMHHGLTEENSGTIEVLVPAATARGDAFSRMPVRRVRSRVPESFTLGVEESEVLGVPFRVTGKARTVVDLFRLGARQHAVSALHAFLAGGGTGDELRAMSEPFGAWQRLAPLVEVALEGVTRAPAP